jgi:hypothetical protein
MDQKRRRFDWTIELESSLSLADSEGTWDHIIRNKMEEDIEKDGQTGDILNARRKESWLREEEARLREGWTRDVGRVKDGIYREYVQEQRRWMERGEKMLEIVEREKALAEQERKERKREKNQAKTKARWGRKQQAQEEDKSEP